MDVSRDVAEIGGDIALDQRAVHLAPAVIDLLDHPDASRDRNLLSCGRRLDDRAELLAAGAHGVFEILLKDGVEFIVVDDPLACDAEDQAAVLGAVDVVGLQQIAKQNAVIVLCDTVKDRQGQHARGKLRGGHLAAGREGAHGLVIQQAERQLFRPRRLDKALLDIELHQRDALNQIPRYHLGQQ